MELKSKYNIGDYVYFFDNNNSELKRCIIKKLRIFEIKVVVTNGWGKQIHNGVDRNEIEVFYKGFTERERCNKDFKHIWISENDLYPTKEDLVISMQRDLNEVINHTITYVNKWGE